MEPVQRLSTYGWITLHEAADLLGVTRQAVSQLALRRNWPRRQLGPVVLVPAMCVDQHAAEKRAAAPA